MLIIAALTTYLLFATAITAYKARYTFFCIIAIFGVIQVIIAAQQFSNYNFWPLPWFSEQIKAWYQPNTVPAMSRGHGLFLNGNHLAWLLNFIALFALGIACLGRIETWKKILATYVAAVSIVGTLLTLSRGGTLGLCAGLLTFAVLSGIAIFFGTTSRKTLGLIVLATLTISIGTGGYFFWSSPTIQERMSKISEDAYRSTLWLAAAKQAQISPIIGTGAGSFTQLSRRLKVGASGADDTFAHNDWAQMTADFGLIGGILTLLVVVIHIWAGTKGFIKALKARSTIYCQPQSNTAALLIGATSSLVAFSVHSFFDFNMQLSCNALLAAICCGIVANPGLATHKQRKYYLLSQGMLLLTSAWLIYAICQHGPAEIKTISSENLMFRQQLEAAEDIAAAGLGRNQNHVKLNSLMGEILLRQAVTSPNQYQKLELAAAHFRKAAALDKDERWHQLMLGITLTRLNQHKEAEEALSNATALDPGNGAIYEYYGVLLEREYKEEEAKHMYEVAATLPGSKFARSRLKELRAKKQ